MNTKTPSEPLPSNDNPSEAPKPDKPKRQIQNSRDKLADRGDDLYESPPEATTSLLALEPGLPQHLWEPMAGRDAITKVLRSAGKEVYSEDLVDRGIAGQHVNRDFLMTGGLLPIHAPEEFRQCIVTNPPYKLADEIITHAIFDLKVPTVICLLRTLYLEGVDGGNARGSRMRSRLIDHRLQRVWISAERLPMMHRDGYEEQMKMDSSAVCYAWFIFGQEETGGLIQTRRFKWTDYAPRRVRPRRTKSAALQPVEEGLQAGLGGGLGAAGEQATLLF